MKKEKSNPHWILKYLPIVATLVLTLVLSYNLASTPYCITPCSGLGSSKGQKFIQYTEILIAFSAVMIALSIVLKFYTHKVFILTILLILLWLFTVDFGLGLDAPCPTSCTFLGRFSCISYKLRAGTSELDFTLAQGTGKNINVTGVECIRAETWNSTTPNIIEPLNKSILIMSGGYAQIVGRGTDNRIYCENQDGLIPSDTSVGSLACLSIYINYTDMANGQSHILQTHPSIHYET